MNSSSQGPKGTAETAPPEISTGNGTTEKLQLKIGGLSCSFCVASITRALEGMEGVRACNVNLAHEEALIEGDPGYSPLRAVYLVAWSNEAAARLLKSASEVRDREAKGEVTVERPGAVVNMPFLTWPGGQR